MLGKCHSYNIHYDIGNKMIYILVLMQMSEKLKDMKDRIFCRLCKQLEWQLALDKDFSTNSCELTSFVRSDDSETAATDYGEGNSLKLGKGGAMNNGH